jgi:hypothetical protein
MSTQISQHVNNNNTFIAPIFFCLLCGHNERFDYISRRSQAVGQELHMGEGEDARVCDWYGRTGNGGPRKIHGERNVFSVSAKFVK